MSGAGLVRGDELTAGVFATLALALSSVGSGLNVGFGGALVRSRRAGSARRTGALPVAGVLIGFLLSLIVVKIGLACF